MRVGFVGRTTDIAHLQSMEMQSHTRRDWPSYVYVALAFVLLFYLPLQVYQLYRRSEMQQDIIASIASGDPDIRQILELGTSDPTANWVGEEVREKPQSKDRGPGRQTT